MKRLNPETNSFFKQGEYNQETGLYFRTYTRKLNKDGFFKESWLTLSSFERFIDSQKNSAKSWSERRYKENRKFIDELKTRKGCKICGFNKHPSALDFDHIDRDKKEFNISEKYGAYRLERIILEINKCDILCANCHRIKTFDMDEHKKIKKPKVQMGFVIDSRMKRDKSRSNLLTLSNKSMMKGVYLSKNGTYFVRGQIDGVRKCFGSFNNAFDAACVAIKLVTI